MTKTYILTLAEFRLLKVNLNNIRPSVNDVLRGFLEKDEIELNQEVYDKFVRDLNLPQVAILKKLIIIKENE